MAPLVAVLAATWLGAPLAVAAAGHREAPLVALDPGADSLDVYAFVSADRPDAVTIIGTWQGLQAKRGGPMFYGFDDTVLHTLNVDNVGDGEPHLSYQFRFHTTNQNPNTYLYALGPVSALDDPDLNVRQTYGVDEVVDGGSVTVLGAMLPVSPPDVGPRTMPSFQALFEGAVHSVTTPDGPIALFAGQADDPAFGELGPLHDVPPAPGARKLKLTDGFKGFNVQTIAIQVPIARLLAGGPAGNTVIGVWAASFRSAQRILDPGTATESGPLVQVSRTGLPLFNDVVLPLALKDLFNGLAPEDDFATYTGVPLLQQAILSPEVATLASTRYAASVPAASRTDVFDVFLRGIQFGTSFTALTPTGKVVLPSGFSVNRPESVQPAEMLRLNTAEAFRPGVSGSLCATKPDVGRGLLGGDLCGFPNGRRLPDDATDIMVRMLAGEAYPLLTGDGGFTFAKKPLAAILDRTKQNDRPFSTLFPYVALPHASYGGK